MPSATANVDMTTTSTTTANATVGTTSIFSTLTTTTTSTTAGNETLHSTTTKTTTVVRDHSDPATPSPTALVEKHVNDFGSLHHNENMARFKKNWSMEDIFQFFVEAVYSYPWDIKDGVFDPEGTDYRKQGRASLLVAQLHAVCVGRYKIQFSERMGVDVCKILNAYDAEVTKNKERKERSKSEAIKKKVKNK